MKKISIYSTEQRKSSIRITVNTGFFGKPLVLHLPPFHKLKGACEYTKALKQLDLTNYSVHTVKYNDLGIEPLVTHIDGYDIDSLWEFLSTEEIMINMLRDLPVHARVEENDFQILQLKFKDYKTEMPINFIELYKFLCTTDESIYEIKYIVVIDILKRVHKGWFYKSTCTNNHCLAIAHQACTGCAKPLCNIECSKNYHSISSTCVKKG